MMHRLMRAGLPWAFLFWAVVGLFLQLREWIK